MRSRFPIFATVCSAAALGCAADARPDDPQSAGADAGLPEARCPADTPEFFAGPTSGLEVTGVNGAVKARLLAADPAPPRRYRNDWTVGLMTPDGAPLQDAQIVRACAFMTVHGHGAPPMTVTPGDQPGAFDLGALNLFMRGPWEIQLAIASEMIADQTARGTDCDAAASGNEYLNFDICVADD